MWKFFKRNGVKFMEPPSMFEQLEERVVLNATIATPGITNQHVTENELPNLHANTLSISVVPSNPSPTQTYSLSVNEGSGWETLAQYDANHPQSDLNIDPSSGLITWHPNNLDALTNSGHLALQATATDSADSTTATTSTINVTVDPVAPQFTTSPSSPVAVVEQPGSQDLNVVTGHQVLASSIDGYGAQYSILTSQLQGATIDPNTGDISFMTPAQIPASGQTSGAATDYLLTVQVADGHGDSTTTVVDLHVTQEAAQFTSQNSTTVSEGQELLFPVDTNTQDQGKTVTYSALAAISDPSGSTNATTLAADLSWLSIDPHTGVISGIPTNSQVGTWTFDVHVNGQDGSQDQTFTLAVKPASPNFLNVPLDSNGNGVGIYDVTPQNSGHVDPLYTTTVLELSGPQQFQFVTDEQGQAPIDPLHPLVDPTHPNGYGYSIIGYTDPTGMYHTYDPAHDPGSTWFSIDPSTGVLTATPTGANVSSNPYTVYVEFNNGFGDNSLVHQPNASDGYGVSHAALNVYVDDVQNQFVSSSYAIWTEGTASTAPGTNGTRRYSRGWCYLSLHHYS